MTNRLYMICPTDHLEYIIREKFDGQKYFYTSLGNSFSIEANEVNEMIQVIRKNKIEEITFIISENNKIILDAINNQEFIDIRGLNNTYSQINKNRNLSRQMWSSHEQHILFLSYHLKDKIRKIRNHLHLNSMHQVKVNGKIYSRAYNSFRAIYQELSLTKPSRVN